MTLERSKKSKARLKVVTNNRGSCITIYKNITLVTKHVLDTSSDLHHLSDSHTRQQLRTQIGRLGTIQCSHSCKKIW
ncbi:protein of unknown function [Candidatus Nitrosotalea okcheonensis]|uniref:Uncharacterized protein n=1 Tax=Candidatus Nitrosotalea okcheonensis TaxID=1903276 RepID=A0A2H1FEN7_9ARCH|nr:protein of unknown function [Candidatus Nitrosotalea okcheonensis]